MCVVCEQSQTMLKGDAMVGRVASGTFCDSFSQIERSAKSSESLFFRMHGAPTRLGTQTAGNTRASKPLKFILWHQCMEWVAVSWCGYLKCMVTSPCAPKKHQFLALILEFLQKSIKEHSETFHIASLDVFTCICGVFSCVYLCIHAQFPSHTSLSLCCSEHVRLFFVSVARAAWQSWLGMIKHDIIPYQAYIGEQTLPISSPLSTNQIVPVNWMPSVVTGARNATVHSTNSVHGRLLMSPTRVWAYLHRQVRSWTSQFVSGLTLGKSIPSGVP